MPRLQVLNSVGRVRPMKKSESASSAVDESGGVNDPFAGKILEILRVRNRFNLAKGGPHWSGGFRDLAFKVRVGFKVRRSAHCELCRPSNNVIAGVFDGSTVVCPDVRMAACALPFHCSALHWLICASHPVAAAGTAGLTPPSRLSTHPSKPSSASCRSTTE